MRSPCRSTRGSPTRRQTGSIRSGQTWSRRARDAEAPDRVAPQQPPAIAVRPRAFRGGHLGGCGGVSAWRADGCLRKHSQRACAFLTRAAIACLVLLSTCVGGAPTASPKPLATRCSGRVCRWGEALRVADRPSPHRPHSCPPCVMPASPVDVFPPSDCPCCRPTSRLGEGHAPPRSRQWTPPCATSTPLRSLAGAPSSRSTGPGLSASLRSSRWKARGRAEPASEAVQRFGRPARRSPGRLGGGPLRHVGDCREAAAGVRQ